MDHCSKADLHLLLTESEQSHHPGTALHFHDLSQRPSQKERVMWRRRGRMSVINLGRRRDLEERTDGGKWQKLIQGPDYPKSLIT